MWHFIQLKTKTNPSLISNKKCETKTSTHHNGNRGMITTIYTWRVHSLRLGTQAIGNCRIYLIFHLKSKSPFSILGFHWINFNCLVLVFRKLDFPMTHSKYAIKFHDSISMNNEMAHDTLNGFSFSLFFPFFGIVWLFFRFVRYMNICHSFVLSLISNRYTIQFNWVSVSSMSQPVNNGLM